MHVALRSPVLRLAAFLLLVPVVALGGGCSGDADSDDNGPTVTATGPAASSATASRSAGSKGAAGPTGSDASDGSGGGPGGTAAVCAPYAAMVAAIKEAATGSTDPEEIAAEIGPVMKEFAAQVPDLDRPPGMPAETWRGVQALAAQITELPDQPSLADIDAVEGALTPAQRDALEDAAAWLRATCA